MSWVQNSVIARPLIAAALLVTATAAAADVLVVRSLGPSAKSFPPGKRIPEAARITLQTSDQLIVLDGRGTRTIRGPGTFTAGAAAPRQVASAAPAQRRARIGAVRGTGDNTRRPPTIWHVDVAKSSNVCVADPTKVTLWRGETTKPVSLSIAGAGKTKQVAWQPGASTLAWPAELPVTEGAEYRLSWAGAAKPTILRFKTMPQKPAGLEDMAQTLIRSQCDAQLDLFIDTVKLPDDKAPAG